MFRNARELMGNINRPMDDLDTRLNNLEAAEGGGALPYVHLQNQQTSGTGGGTATTGSWGTCVLNTEVSDTASICTLSSNQFTLPEGTYRLFGSMPFHDTNGMRLRLYNVTDAAAEFYGQFSWEPTTDNVISVCSLRGLFTLTTSETLRIEYSCDATKATTGQGYPSSRGVAEVYLDVEIWKRA